MSTESMIPLLRAAFDEQINRIAEIDTQLDPQAAGKASVRNAAIEAAGDMAPQAEANIHTLLASQPENVVVGVVTHLLRSLKKEYGAKIDAYIEANVVDVEPISEELANKLNAERTQLVAQAKVGRDFLIAYNIPEAELPKVPSKRGRAKGTTMGPRLKGTFNFSVDGTPVDGHKLGDLAKVLEAASVAEVRAAIEAANADFDFAEPPAEFSFTLNDKSVVAVQAQTDETEEEIEDNEPEVSSDDEFNFDD